MLFLDSKHCRFLDSNSIGVYSTEPYTTNNFGINSALKLKSIEIPRNLNFHSNIKCENYYLIRFETVVYEMSSLKDNLRDTSYKYLK